MASGKFASGKFASGKFASGKHELVWDGRNRAGELAANGTYIYRMTVQASKDGATIVMTKKIAFLKFVKREDVKT